MFRVLGFGFRASGFGIRDSGSGFGFRVSGFGVRVSGFEFRVSCFGVRVSGFGCRVSGFGFRDSGFGFRDSGFGFRVSGFGFRGSGFGFRVSGFGLRGSRFGFILLGSGARGLYSGFRFGGWVSGFGVYCSCVTEPRGVPFLVVSVWGLGFGVSGFRVGGILIWRYRPPIWRYRPPLDLAVSEASHDGGDQARGAHCRRAHILSPKSFKYKLPKLFKLNMFPDEPREALRGGIPGSFLEPLGRSWSHFVGMLEASED